jgi:hypothetical protein
LTDEALADVDSEESLAAFLERLVSELQAEASRLPQESDPVVDRVVREFAKLVAEFCEDPCDLLEQLAAAVARTAADFYRSSEVAVPIAVWDQTVPVIKFLGGRIGLSFDPDLHFELSTMFDQDDPSSSKVVFKVAPEWLDLDTIAAMPRALLHEYISHVPQGPYLAPRSSPYPDDGFAEGWMDYVAHRVHRSVLDRQGGPSEALTDHLALTWMWLYERTAERFYSARCDSRDGDWEAASRYEGAEAAHQLHDLLRHLQATKLLGTKDNADELLYQLSFGINSSKISNVSRRRFAAEVRLCLSQASHGSDVLVPALREWVAGQIDLGDLVARLLD